MELGTFQNLCMRHIENAKDQLMKKWVINMIWCVCKSYQRKKFKKSQDLIRNYNIIQILDGKNDVSRISKWVIEY